MSQICPLGPNGLIWSIIATCIIHGFTVAPNKMFHFNTAELQEAHVHTSQHERERGREKEGGREREKEREGGKEGGSEREREREREREESLCT